MALRFNTFRARRYLRSRFVEGAFLLASEASDIELELLDLMRKTVQDTLGDVAIADAWKVERLSATQLLIKPGEAWFKGLPFKFRSGKDQLVSGAILTSGIVPVATTIADDTSGLGKVITFNDGGTTPSNDYRIVITAREELITDVEDPFLQNANLTESTAQKVRLIFQINIVPETSQTTTPVPYTDENSVSGSATNFPDVGGFASPNLSNEIVVTPTAAGNGELVNLALITGSEKIDGRDVEVTVRNDIALGAGNPIPNSVSEQAAFETGTLIDSRGNEYHINAIFNDTVSTQVVIRIDKEPDQPNPEIINTFPFTLKKRDVYATDGINGNPQGKLYWPTATAAFNSVTGVAHESSISDLRTSIIETNEYQTKTNNKFGLQLAEGGSISYDNATSLVTWGADLKIVNPHGSDQTIAASSEVMQEGGALVYDLDLDTGGNIERGSLAVNVTVVGATSTLDPAALSTVRQGNIVVDSGGVVAEIIGIDDVNDQITTSPALANLGGATIYQDSFAPGTAPLSLNSYVLAVRSNNTIYFGGSAEIGDGQTEHIGEGVSQQLLTYMGASGEDDADPNYSSTNVVTQGGSLTQAVGELDANTIATAGSIADLTTRSNVDRNIKMIGGGTYSWTLSSNALVLSANAFIQVPDFDDDRNTILAQTITLAANEVAYVDLNRVTDATTNLTVSVANINALTVGDNTVIIARRDGSDVIVGTGSFRLKDGERLELDGALAEINRLLGQLRITAHETDADKVRVAGADTSLLDGNTLSQELNNFFLSFDGAVIDFTTGDVFESDGTTPLGINFTPQTIPVGEYFWYGLAILPGSTLTSDNRQTGQMQVTLAASSDVGQTTAPFPLLIGDKKLGGVQVQNNAGSIEVVDIRRLGVGSGSGSGSGTGNTILETIKNRLLEGPEEAATPNIFRDDEDDLLDVSSTASFSPASKALEFSAIGQTMVSIDMLDTEFLAKGVGISEIELLSFWDLDSLDPAATYEVSRNGGAEYQAVTMERIADTELFRGRHAFATEAADQTILSQATSNAQVELDATSNQLIGQELTLANTTEIRELDLDMTINDSGSLAGNIFVSLYDDNAGLPGTVIVETSALPASSLVTGTNTIDIPTKTLVAGTYHIVVRTDLEYKTAFVTGVDSIELDTDTGGTDGATNNGTIWAAGAFDLVYAVRGIELDLRVRITSSVADVALDAYSIHYDAPIEPSQLVTGVKNRQVFKFKAVADNLDTFAITGFNIEPDLIKVHYVEAGQTLVYPAFNINGNTLEFATDQFNNGGVEADVTLVVDQTRGGAFDNSDLNALLMASNHLGSTDPTVDKSSAGRGIFLRRPDGTLREITIDNSDNIAVFSV